MSASAGPDIITDGLVLCLDAGNRDSYPGSGDTWRDISNNGNNGTLTNSPTFNSANGGSIVFDGSNDYISTTYTPPTANYTITAFFKSNTYSGTHNRGIFSTFSVSDYNGIYFATKGNLGSGNQMWFWADGNSSYTLPFQFSVGEWYQVTFIVTDSQISCYINTKLITQVNDTTTHKDVLNIGRSRFDANYLNGNIAQTQIYNRALTPQEVLQNYNATKGRFGLA